MFEGNETLTAMIRYMQQRGLKEATLHAVFNNYSIEIIGQAVRNKYRQIIDVKFDFDQIIDTIEEMETPDFITEEYKTAWEAIQGKTSRRYQTGYDPTAQQQEGAAAVIYTLRWDEEMEEFLFDDYGCLMAPLEGEEEEEEEY